MIILGVESSAQSASCAVSVDGKIAGEFFINNKLTHSATLMPMIEAMLKTSEISLGDCDYIAVSAGPGSFTGIRIGICTVKGLAFAGNIPCVGVSTLNAAAHGMTMLDGVICAVMDARCSQVYNALFAVKDGIVTRLCEDRAISIEELCSELSGYGERVYIIGDGTDIFMSKCTFSGAVAAPYNVRYQRAGGVCEAARIYLEEGGNAVTSHELMPFYLRQAKIN